MKHDAIVLLGFSGAGKDTTYAAINDRLQNKAYNVKFGLLAKAIVASFYSVPLHYLEDKRWRDISYDFGLSPSDLLTVLYRGCTEKLTAAHIKYALKEIPSQHTPVFTDIRRFEEAQAVVSNFSKPLFVYLWSMHVNKGVNDGLIEEIAREYKALVIQRDYLTPDDIANTILEVYNNG